jgi:hypothetical protein
VPESISLLSEPQGEYDSGYTRNGNGASSSGNGNGSSSGSSSSSSSSGNGSSSGSGWMGGINLLQSFGIRGEQQGGEQQGGRSGGRQQGSGVAQAQAQEEGEDDQFYVRMLAELVELGRALTSDASKDLEAVQLAAGQGEGTPRAQDDRDGGELR